MAALVYIFMRAILSPQHCLNDAYQRTFKHFMRNSLSNLMQWAPVASAPNVHDEDVQALLRSARFKLRRDRVEFGIRRPQTSDRKVFTAIFELTFSNIVRRVDEMEFVRHIHLLKQRPKPYAA